MSPRNSELDGIEIEHIRKDHIRNEDIVAEG